MKRIGWLLILVGFQAMSPGAVYAGEPLVLFDGKTLAGWHLASTPEDAEKARQFWRVEEGVIVCDTAGDRGHDYIWLVSDDEYDDFELTLEVKSDSKGNSGVQIRSRYDYAERWLNGPQVDIHPGGGWRSGLIYDETRGVQRWINPDLPGSKIDQGHAVQNWSWKKEGWNTLRIRCRGIMIETEVNGTVISAYNGAGMLDDEHHQKHRVGLKGHIALQLHKKNDLKIAFRNLQLKVLKTGGTAVHQAD